MNSYASNLFNIVETHYVFMSFISVITKCIMKYNILIITCQMHDFKRMTIQEKQKQPAMTVSIDLENTQKIHFCT